MVQSLLKEAGNVTADKKLPAFMEETVTITA
jgi:hypothetical protein